MSATDPPSRERPSAEPASQRSDHARASTGDAASDDDEDQWRHEPVAPVDEGNPLKSLGHAVADVVTGGAEDTAKDTAKPRPR
jgi:hypothetical protein